jgi:hypothetical protein
MLEMSFEINEVSPRPSPLRKYPQLGPELQFETDPDRLRQAFHEKGLTLPDELREGEDPRAESYDEWKES